MSYSLDEIVLGALLHDIGKFIQRAFRSTQALSWKTYDMESTLCPKNKHQQYTHRHVLFTNAFFDLLKERTNIFPAGVDIDRVAHAASFHHSPDTAPNPAAAWICTLADWYSSGMDRKKEDEAESDPKTREAYRRLPLRSIFDDISIDPKREGPAHHGYRLRALNPDCPESLIPQPWAGEQPGLPKDYENLWKEFEGGLFKFHRASTHSAKLFEETLLGLLERYTWAIPSSTMDIPDISLFDHSRTTAAIAACLFRYHQERSELADLSAIKDGRQPKFRFLAGDLSGIQSTLFTLASQGVKGVNKILRARSFLLGAIVEAATLHAIEAFGLPASCIVQQAGGRFLILVPDAKDAGATLEELRKRFDYWLLDHYTGSLALNLSLTEPFPGSDFQAANFRRIQAEIARAVDEAKQRPLSSCPQGILKHDMPYDRICSACGVRPAHVHENTEYRCRTCQSEVEIGRRLTGADISMWTRGPAGVGWAADILGLSLALCKASDLNAPKESMISIRSLRADNPDSGLAPRVVANYIPRFENEQATRDPRYDGLVEPDFRFLPGIPKTFTHIGAEALEPDADGRNFRGKPFLAILKADVDRLGYIFNYGLQRTDTAHDRFTLSRLSQLSRMMDLYFSGYLQGMVRREFPDTYTVYAGGDDLLLIGPWRQSLDLARRISESFADYTGNNPSITISAGISLIHPNHPVNRAVAETEVLLEKAKNAGRNRICALLGKPLTWDRFKARLEDAEWIHAQLNGRPPVSSGFVYRIMEIARDVESVDQGMVGKAGWRAKLAYHLARNIKAKSDRERQQRIKEWLERLGLDDMLKLTKGQSNITDWRLPLSIALYRNR